jgi:hypothetical protein
MAVFRYRDHVNNFIGTRVDPTKVVRDSLSAAAEKLNDSGVTRAEIKARNGRGRGIGGFLGRLATGRLTSSSRRKDSVVQERFDNEVADGFEETRKNYEWVEKNYSALEKHDMSVAEGREHQKQYMREFSEAGVERGKQLKDAAEAHDRDFYPDLFDKNEIGEMIPKAMPTIRDIMANENMSGLNTLGRQDSRISLARLYMISKGCTIDQIFENTPEGSARRSQYGKEMMEEIKKGPENCGKMFADMGKAYADLPVPDISSDAAILKNMRDIETIRTMGIDFNQIMVMRKEGSTRELNPVEAAYEKNTTKEERDKTKAALDMNTALHYLGHLRATVIKDGTLDPDYKMPKPSPYHNLMYAGFSQKHRAFIENNIRPGMKMSEGGEIGIKVEGMIQKHTNDVSESGIDEKGLRDQIIEGATIDDLNEMGNAAHVVKNEIATEKMKSAEAFDYEGKRDYRMYEKGVPFEMFQKDVPAGFYDDDEPKIQSSEPENNPGEIVIESNSLNISDFEKPQMGSSDYVKTESKEISIEINN